MRENDKNGLEEFMHSHRDDFDMHEPPAGLWDKISKRKEELDQQESDYVPTPKFLTEKPDFLKEEVAHKEEDSPKGKTIQFPRWIGQVAAAIVISLSSIFIYEQIRSTSNSTEIASNDSTTIHKEQITEQQVVSKTSDFEEAEQFYQVKVQEQLHKIQQVAYYDETLQSEVQYDLAELDSAYVELKRDLRQGMANEEIIEAMIQTHRLKLHILEEVLQELEKSSKKEEEYETLDI